MKEERREKRGWTGRNSDSGMRKGEGVKGVTASIVEGCGGYKGREVINISSRREAKCGREEGNKSKEKRT